VSAAFASAVSRLERGLAYCFRPFAKVEPGETITAALLTLTVLLLPMFNLGLITLWIVAVFAIGRENARRGGETEERIAAEPLLS
jgi:hypothetical protein